VPGPERAHVPDQWLQAAISYSLTLVYVSSDHRVVRGGCHGGGEGAEELARDVSLEAAFDLADGLAFGSTAGDVGLLGSRTRPCWLASDRNARCGRRPL